jgi:hypothetical protein
MISILLADCTAGIGSAQDVPAASTNTSPDIADFRMFRLLLITSGLQSR